MWSVLGPAAGCSRHVVGGGLHCTAGGEYYYHSETGQSQYEPPLPAAVADVPAAPWPPPLAPPATPPRELPQPDGEADDDIVPRGWRKRESTIQGEYYVCAGAHRLDLGNVWE